MGAFRGGGLRGWALLACLLACRADGPLLLYTTKNEVRSTNASRPGRVASVVRGLEKAMAVDFCHEGRDICWSDFDLEEIKCISQTTGQTTLVLPECASYGLAVDWYARKLYWTDREKYRIEVASLDSGRRKVLFWSDIDEPRAIAVAPMRGLLFWTDWGEVAKIERAAMNGDPDSRKVIVDTKIFWPNALTIDYETDRIYWLDAKLLFVDAMDFDGGNRTSIMRDQLVYAVSLTIFRDKLYWADWKTLSIYSWDISTKGPVRDVVPSEKEPTDVKVWDARRQPRPTTPHPCAVNNGNCSHLCLLSPDPPGYTCACSTGIKLENKYKCADEPQSQLILVQRMSIRRISLDSPDYTSFVIPLKDIKNAATVDYNPKDKYFYWSDSEAFTISRAKIDGSNQSVVLHGNLEGIAIDSVAGNIYWTDPSARTIMVSRLDGASRKVVISDDLVSPRAIALATSLGWMFWSDWTKHNIERASLDGTDRLPLLSEANGVGWPNGIALDIKAKKVYWGDGYNYKIGVCNMDGTDKMELLSENLRHIFGLTLLGDYIYWTDWQRRSLSRVNKLTGERQLIAEHFENIMGLTAFDSKKEPEVNPCYYNNGNCSHFCFNRPTDYVCGCPIGLEFGKDNKTCVKPTAFLLYTRKDKIGRLSIENSNNHVILPIKDIKDATALAAHVADNRVYWADSKLKSISRSSINGSNAEKVIDWTNVIDGLALDWCSKNLYWTDFTAQRIEVSRLDGSHRRALIWQGLKKPKSIVVDPMNGYMYWSEWGKTIKRAYMDGSHPIVIIDQVGHASGLNIDFEKGKLIWGTMDPPMIEMADLNGNNREKLLSKGVKVPYSLTLDKDGFYWANLNSGEVSFGSILNSTNNTVMYRNLDDITGMNLYHESRQVGENPCSVNNGGCSHLCIPIPSLRESKSVNYKCACATHYTLNKDNKTCSAPTEFILFSHRNGIGRVIIGGSDCPDTSLQLFGLKSVKAIEYDPLDRRIYWIDVRLHSIRYISESGSGDIGVIAKGIVVSSEIALDAIGRTLYFSCPETNSINITRLDNNTSSVGTVIHGDGIIPKHIAIHQTQRLLFWVDMAKGIIMSSSMDGLNRLEIAQAPNITALTLDPYTDTLFWANSKQIFASTLDGSNRRIIWQGGSVTSLAVLKSTLYWIDMEKHLMHLPLNVANAPALPLLRFPPLADVIAVHKVDTKHPCSGGGGCIGVCLTDKTCGCVRGLLSPDGRSRCSLPPPCAPTHFTCASIQQSHTNLIDKLQTRECLPQDWRCDGQLDCDNGFDELNCNKCPEGKFRCPNDQCIEDSQVCDGVRQCSDGHDEMHCCSEPRSFRCPSNGICINANFVCDQVNHCPDGADESLMMCTQNRAEVSSANSKLLYFIFAICIAFGFIVYGFFYCRNRLMTTNPYPEDDKAADPLSPKPNTHNHKIGAAHSNGNSSKSNKIKLMDGVRMSTLNGSSTNSYDRNHITGASSSATNGSNYVGRYPREPLNPPPSPATTAPSSNAPSRHRPYRHYKVINQPPPPTPCSTDVCDESDCTISYHVSGFGMYLEAPPPTPCPPSPPSPSSRSSTYLSPVPPPPSPVPPHYDS